MLGVKPLICIMIYNFTTKDKQTLIYVEGFQVPTPSHREMTQNTNIFSYVLLLVKHMKDKTCSEKLVPCLLRLRSLLVSVWSSLNMNINILINYSSHMLSIKLHFTMFSINVNTYYGANKIYLPKLVVEISPAMMPWWVDMMYYTSPDGSV